MSKQPHPVQEALWKEFADLGPGVTPREWVGDDNIPVPEKLTVEILIANLTVEQARALLLAAREIKKGSGSEQP